MDRFLRPLRLIFASFVLLTLAFSISAPAVFSLSSAVTGDLSLNPSVDCNGTLGGDVKIINDGSLGLTVNSIEIVVTDSALHTTIGDNSLAVQSPFVPPLSSKDFPFTVKMTGGTTKLNPEPATVTATVVYALASNSSARSGLKLDAGFLIANCPLHTASSEQPLNNTGGLSEYQIPEFPIQLVALIIVTVVIAASYLLIRDRAVPGSKVGDGSPG